jgi:hypothetical protein
MYDSKSAATAPSKAVASSDQGRRVTAALGLAAGASTLDSTNSSS